MSPLSSFRLALGSPTLANSGPAPAGSLKDDSGMREHLAAGLKGVRMITCSFPTAQARVPVPQNPKTIRAHSQASAPLSQQAKAGLSGTAAVPHEYGRPESRSGPFPFASSGQGSLALVYKDDNLLREYPFHGPKGPFFHLKPDQNNES